MKYCKNHRLFVLEERKRKKKNPETKKKEEITEYKLEGGKWYGQSICKIVELRASQINEVNLNRDRVANGKHFIRRLKPVSQISSL